GVGKTRLALAAAAALADAYPQRVVFGDLALVRNDRMVAATIARPWTSEKVADAAHMNCWWSTREPRLLPVLDNFEHLQGPDTVTRSRAAHAKLRPVARVTDDGYTCVLFDTLHACRASATEYHALVFCSHSERR